MKVRILAAAVLAALFTLLPLQAASAKPTGHGRDTAPGQLKKQPEAQVEVPTPPVTVPPSPKVPQPQAGGPVVGQKQVDPAPTGGHNPPGNNGTIKVDREPFDNHPDNQPHVGCQFQVDFYGFDQGQLFADVNFELWSPTKDGQLIVHGNTHPFIGEDDASGGGSEAGLDASETYSLEFPGVTPHPQQGVHVKLTVHADGSQGADTKHKVFWVQPCEQAPPTTTVPPTTTTLPPPPADYGPPIPPVRLDLGRAYPAPVGQLPRTGFEMADLLLPAAVIIPIGALFVLAGRFNRRRLANR